MANRTPECGSQEDAQRITQQLSAPVHPERSPNHCRKDVTLEYWIFGYGVAKVRGLQVECSGVKSLIEETLIADHKG